ncbi:MAG: cytidylyltransferase domain-containing protein [Actinomycetota bacterium]
MRCISIVQARMGSTRFPGKSLEDLNGAPLLLRVLERIARASRIDDLWVATTLEQQDDELAQAASETGYNVFRGSTDDVLDRYVQAARSARADLVVRNTADEPFVDPLLIDECIQALSGADYMSNNLVPTYPEGVDTEVVSIEALEIAWREATRASDREHVTPFIWRQPDRFRLASVEVQPLHPDWRLTVDYPQDLEFARACYERLPDGFVLNDVVELLEMHPELLALCPSVPRREGYWKSVSDE